MRKNYEQAKIHVVLFDEQDCVRASGVGVQWDSEWNKFFSDVF